MPLKGYNLSCVEIRSAIPISNCQPEFPLDTSKRFVRDRVKPDTTDTRGSAIQNALGQALIKVGHDLNDQTAVSRAEAMHEGGW